MAVPPLIRITSSAHFSAAHRLQNDAKDAEWNARTFGKCNNVYGHGHTYVLEVTVEGPVDAETGWVMDFSDLKRLVDEKIVSRCNCRNLNTDVSFLRDVNPTAENLAVKFWEELAPALAPGRLVRIELHETPRNKAVYTGETERPAAP